MDKDNKTSAKEEREKMGRVIEAIRVLEDISKKQSTVEEKKNEQS